ncbi:type VI secretion system ATPase TssH [Desulfosarcina sp.]|uniref:type VI secretion system ATPase TssH n=1 Tax=Desulfosarcina sp. TaxID=2027861 RepID=UPI0029A7906F|nr:type VI secretion system ATPase TssH [Desulfosarcina sp.]MDX2451177.1 type VI secretion system ATPase TssH [Desulfosarcina sp.]
MAEINRTSLFGKLNSLAYKSMESATVFCKMRGNPYVELMHFLNMVLQLQDSDLHHIVKHYDLNPSRLASDMTSSLDSLPRGATSLSDFSPHLEEAVERAWVYSSLLFGEPQVRTGHMVIALLKAAGLKAVLPSISSEFTKIKVEDLSDNFSSIVGGSPEDALFAQDGTQVGGGVAPGEASGAVAPAVMGKQQALAQFSVDLTQTARKGLLDPILGRDDEIRQIVDILMRRRQNNPILTGEAGVGKTAVVEGFAQRIVSGNIPPPLQDVSVRTLDLGLLQAGASMKGEFENRLRQVIEEVQASPKPIILFIDEAHTLIGAGGAAGSGDAANLLKPALARGTLRTIAATTWAEYKKYIEKDAALTRRFQVVKIDEPSEDKAIMMMRGLAGVSEKHHRVQILDEALVAAVQLSHRYIPARQLPDKAVSLLDTACARVSVSLHATPAAVEACRQRVCALETENEILAREEAVGMEHPQRRLEIQKQLTQEVETLKQLDGNWQKEKNLVDKVLELRGRLRAGTGQSIDEKLDEKLTEANLSEETTGALQEQGAPDAEETAKGTLTEKERESMMAELKQLIVQLSEIQGETPLILPSVDEQAVASVVADWTGVPVGRMVKNEIKAIMHLADTLEERVIGQRHALDTIARRMQTSRAKLENPSRPIGVFMFVGPSGVGKTESALALAEALYGGEQNVITINMSEFQEAHTVSTLKGAPPGYVGYGEGGVLTEAVRRRPYSIVLLDEVEKAHKDVHEVFFQVFDKGRMEDGEGRMIDFKNTIILLTSNVGTDLIMNMCKDPELMPEPAGIAKALREPLLKVFPPAFLGRLLVVPFYPLSDEVIRKIVGLQLDRIKKRIQENHRIPFTYDDAVVELINSRCTEVESGARMVDAILSHTLLPEISSEILSRMMEGQELTRIHVGVKEDGFAYAFA